MLCRELMPRSNDPALEQREGGFDAVRRDVSFDMNAICMVDGLVFADAVDNLIQAVLNAQ